MTGDRRITWDEMLADSLADHRLSRGERKAMLGHLEDEPLEPHERDVLRARAFELAQEVLEPSNATDVLAWLDGVTRILVKGSTRDARAPEPAEAWFSPGDDCRRAILAELRATRRAADVCVFTITDDELAIGITEALRRGVAVRIMTDDEKADDPGSDIRRLAVVGVEVRVDRSPTHMHHKFALFDDRSVLTGSYNWTRSAALGNSENLIVTSDPALVAAYRREFDRLWAHGGALE